jgi:bifunctional DNA-binding transcriptional regulator/antitoxin component of YhaV-PrlF toxin-antitoxin module
MTTLTVAAKGQVTLRKVVPEHLGVRPGEKIAVERLPSGRIEVRAARRADRISETFNLLKSRKRRHLSIDNINSIIARIIARCWAGTRLGSQRRISARRPGLR